MIDVETDRLLSLGEVAERLPRIRTRVVANWVRDGRRGKKLEAIKIGQSWFTTWASVRSFLASDEDHEPLASPTASAERADVELAALGL